MRYVLYHGNCYDGFGAAFAAWKKFGDADTKYIAVSYGAALPQMPNAREILIVDFSYPQDVILELSKVAQVKVFDHHKTAQEALAGLAEDTKLDGAGNPRVVFDMERSGALITWDELNATPAPELIRHISDRDLWQFKLEGSRAVHKALVSLPMKFEIWDQLDITVLKTEGAAMERLHDQLVKNIIQSAWLGKLGGYDVPMVNTSIAWSEVGEALLDEWNKGPRNFPMVASFTVMENSIMWSLRSAQEFDCSEVAKKFGGGGHKNAAGFKAARF